MMKKKLLLTALIFGIGAIFFSGCGAKKEANQDKAPVDSTEIAKEAVFDYKVKDFVTLGEYKGLSIKYPIPEVTDEDLQMKIEELLSENTDYNGISGRGAKNGDYLNIDFVGTIDGEEFEGGSSEGYEFTLGEGEFLEDFEKNLIDKKEGEETVFRLTFPKDYSEDVGGKEAEFTVTINSISEVVTPEYNDAFVAEVTEYETMKAYEEAMKAELMETAEKDARTSSGEDALMQAVGNAKIEGYPQALYDACYNVTLDEYKAFAEMFGMQLEDFMSDFMEGSDLDSITLDTVNELLVAQAIAEQEGFSITGDNYKEEAKKMAAENGYDSVEDFMEDYGYSEVSIRTSLIREKAIGFLYENANIKEVSQEEYYGQDEEISDTEE